MAAGGVALFLVARFVPEHEPSSRQDTGMHQLHDAIGIVFLVGGVLQSWGTARKIRVLEAARGFALIGTGALVAIDSQMHGGDQLRTMIALALIQAALIELAQYIAREEARVLGTFAWLLVAVAGVAFVAFGAGEGRGQLLRPEHGIDLGREAELRLAESRGTDPRDASHAQADRLRARRDPVWRRRPGRAG